MSININLMKAELSACEIAGDNSKCAWAKTFRWFRKFVLIVFFVSSGRANSQTISWSPLRGPYSGSIQLLTVNQAGDVYGATLTGIYRSTDKGGSWQEVYSPPGFGYEPALAVDSSNNVYYGDYTSGLFESTDRGTSWFKASLARSATAISVISGNRLCVGGYLTFSISKDGGKTWSVSQVRDSTNPGDASSIVEDSFRNIYVGYYFVQCHGPVSPYGGGIYVSSDSGKTWRLSGLESDSVVYMAADKAGKVFSLGSNGIYSLAPKSSYWMYDEAGIPLGATIGALQTDRFGEAVIVTDKGILVYDDTKSTWTTAVPVGMYGASITTAIYDPSGTSYAGTESDGLYFLDNSTSTWISCGVYPASITSVCFDGSGNLFAGTADGIFEEEAKGGSGWIRASDELGQVTVYQLYSSASEKVVLASTNGGLFYLPDSGIYWIPLTRAWVYDFIETSSGDYAGSTGGILTAYGLGVSWNPLQTVGLPIMNIYCLALDPSGNFFVGTSRDGVFMSADSGYFWTQTGINSPIIFCSVKTLAIDSSDRIFAGTDTAGAYYSDNFGTSWNTIPSISGKNVTCFLLSQGSTYLSGTLDRGVFISTDRGLNWQPANNGLTNSSVASLTFDQYGYLYAATDSGVFKSTSIVLGIHENKTVPSSFDLYQNYPNPFNPSTEISYQVSAVSHVTLTIYDVLGREVKTLVNETKAPGKYEVRFDGTGLSSGLYFYRIKAGNYTETKKMVLVK